MKHNSLIYACFPVCTRIQTSTSVYKRLSQSSTLNIQKSLKPTMPLSQKTPEDHATQKYTPPQPKVTTPQKESTPFPTPTPSTPHQMGLRQPPHAVRGAPVPQPSQTPACKHLTKKQITARPAGWVNDTSDWTYGRAVNNEIKRRGAGVVAVPTNWTL